jgi:hypothetical protein
MGSANVHGHGWVLRPGYWAEVIESFHDLAGVAPNHTPEFAPSIVMAVNPAAPRTPRMVGFASEDGPGASANPGM